MKAYKIEIFVIDFESGCKEDLLRVLDNNKHYNFQVKEVKETDIGEWRDEHELNQRRTCEKAYKELIWT